MFDHLFSPEMENLEDMTASEIVSAQVKTMNWIDTLVEHDATLPTDTASADTARQAFVSMMDPSTPPDTQVKHVLALQAPEAVRHLVGMLTEYDWAFQEQAKEIRSFVVAKLLEETKDGNGRIRLKALELLGKVTEVAAFTERSEIVHKHETSGDIEERVRERLKKFLPPVLEVQDAEVKEIAIVPRGKKE
jgi:hypothetical protein